MQLFLFRELLGAIRAKSALFFVLSGVLLFVFLAAVSSFFMLAPVQVSVDPEAEPIDEIRVSLSPTLSSETVNQLFLDWRERDEVRRINLNFEELNGMAAGKVFIVQPANSEDSEALVQEFREVRGVIDVAEVRRTPETKTGGISLAIRLSLLGILVLSIAASLVCSRRAYRELLNAFSGEIRLLRLSGISDRLMTILVVALGVLIGLLCGLLLLAVLYLLHQIALVEVSAFAMFGGLASGARILGGGLVGVLLGMVLGGLAGLLGASLLHRREFDPLP